MNLIEEYKKYRQIGMELNQKIMEVSNDLIPNALLKSAKLLNLVNKDGTLIFDSEYETHILMDFMITEYQTKERRVVEIYKEKIGGENDIENEILDGLIASYTSLFKVVSTSKKEKTLTLYNILNKQDTVEIIDINLSNTATPNFLVFLKVIPLKYFNMNSGILFIFQSALEKRILNKYKLFRKSVRTSSSSIKRFIAFHKINKIYGLETRGE